MEVFAKKNKEMYYSSDKIDETGAVYRMIIGQRSNGKTYCCIKKAIEAFFNNGKPSAYIRRYAEEIKAKNIQELLSPHYDLIKKLSKGKYNCAYFRTNNFYLGLYDMESGEWKERSKDPILYTVSINNWNTSKGQDRGELNYIIFDEFMTRDGYLVNEFSSFANVLSSLIRSRDGVVVYMLANTVNKYCPYFLDMGITHAAEQEQGTIELYSYNNEKLTVAVELCTTAESTKEVEYYYAFDNPQLEMIKTGAWETDSYRHLCQLEFNLNNEQTMLYRFYLKFNQQTIIGEIHQHGCYLALVWHKVGNSQYQIKDTDIVFTDQTTSNVYQFNSFRGKTKLHILIGQLFAAESDYYENNSIGEIVNNFRKWSGC